MNDWIINRLMPAIEEKRKLTREYYRRGGEKSKEKLMEMRRTVSGLVDAAKIRWLEKKARSMKQNIYFYLPLTG